jgi:YidC/Oxa1 family membrane protein insertase
MKKAMFAAHKESRKRERADAERFYTAKNKQLVFYSERSGYYKYFENVIDYILEHSKIIIHYVTSDPDDNIFHRNDPRIVPYYIGRIKLIGFMMQIDAGMVVMTMPDIQKYYIKRSMVRKNIEYVYMFHAPLSFIMTLQHGALDHYDTIFCTGMHQELEIRESEKLYRLPAKKVIACGYGVIENMARHYLTNREKYENRTKRRILIAPSWQYDNILDSCLDELMNNLRSGDWQIVIRPHPEYVKRFPGKWKVILGKYENSISDDIILETDFSSNETVYGADIVITDWSFIAFEFSFAILKPALFINTKMKVMNPKWRKIPIPPLSIDLRSEIGIQLEKNELTRLRHTVEEMLQNSGNYADKIRCLREQYLFHFGESGRIGGEYIINTLSAERALKNEWS